MIMMMEGMGRKLSTMFGKTPSEKAAALVFQLPGDKAREKLVGLGADAVPSLLAVLRGTSEESAAGSNDVRSQMRGAAAEVVVRIGMPAFASLRPLVVSKDINDKRLGHSLARKILARALERADADEGERKAAGAEVLRMMGSVHGAEIRLGIAFAANVPGEDAVGVLAWLAKEGWSAAQKDACNARMAGIMELRSLAASKTDINSRTNKGSVPEAGLLKVMMAVDQAETVDALAREYNIEDAMERNSTRMEAVMTLGKMGNAAAVGALLGLLDTVEYNPDVMTLGGLDCRIADELRGAVGRGPELKALLTEAMKKWNAAEREETAKAGMVSDSPERRKAAHIAELLSGVL